MWHEIIFNLTKTSSPYYDPLTPYKLKLTPNYIVKQLRKKKTTSRLTQDVGANPSLIPLHQLPVGYPLVTLVHA